MTFIAVLVGYQLLLIGIGLWARERSRTHDDYFVGGRRMGGLVASLSYAAGSSSAWSILGVTGIAYTDGISALWLLPGTISGHLVTWFYLAPRMRARAARGQWVTLTDLLVVDLPRPVRAAVVTISSCAILISFAFYVAAQFQGAGTTLAASLDVSVTQAIVIGALVIVIYTLLGGFWAVSVTDAVQAGLMLTAAMILPTVALLAVGGPGELWSQLPESHTALLGDYAGFLALGFLLGMVSIGFGPLGQPHLLNRIIALEDEAALRRARSIAITWFVIVLGGMFIAGLCAHVLVRVIDDPESVFFALTGALLPALLAAMLTAAVLSAVMSTADSQLLVAASVAAHDLKLGHDRLSVVAVAFAAVLIALLLPEAIFSRVLFAWNALGATFGPVVLLRIMRRPIAPVCVPIAMLTGFGLTVLFYALPDTPGDFAERFVPFMVATAILACWPATAGASAREDRR